MTDRIWAPWRCEYVTDPDKGGCFICDARESDDDAASLVVLRAEHSLIVMNRYPYTSGHLMITPKRHVGSLADMNDQELLEMVTLLRESENVLRDTMNPHGLNAGINIGRTAGAGLVGHIHMHVVPRWDGDTNFMDVLADTTVISQGLVEQRSILAEAFRTRQEQQ